MAAHFIKAVQPFKAKRNKHDKAPAKHSMFAHGLGGHEVGTSRDTGQSGLYANTLTSKAREGDHLKARRHKETDPVDADGNAIDYG